MSVSLGTSVGSAGVAFGTGVGSAGVAGSAGAAAPTDPYFANVVSLLHFDGNFTDVTGKTWTGVGDANANGASQTGFGNALALDGMGDGISTPDSADFHVAAGDYTIEGWIKAAAAGQSNNSTVFMQATAASSPFGWAFIILANGTYNLRLYSSSNQTSWNSISNAAIGTLTQNQWHFFSVSRQSTNVYCHLDGILGSTSAVGTTSYPDRAHPVWVGGGDFDFTYLSGLLDDFRITKGVGRYGAANYTPPTAPFPDA